jgi:hypothetical protein
MERGKKSTSIRTETTQLQKNLMPSNPATNNNNRMAARGKKKKKKAYRHHIMIIAEQTDCCNQAMTVANAEATKPKYSVICRWNLGGVLWLGAA